MIVMGNRSRMLLLKRDSIWSHLLVENYIERLFDCQRSWGCIFFQRSFKKDCNS